MKKEIHSAIVAATGVPFGDVMPEFFLNETHPKICNVVTHHGRYPWIKFVLVSAAYKNFGMGVCGLN